MVEREMPCPSCGCSHVTDLGKLRAIDGAIKLNDPGHLKRCFNCNLFFRYPYLDSIALKKAYSNIKAFDMWVYEDRVDYRLARQAVSDHCSSGKVLDVGCFRGDFLQTLSDDYDCYGIETSPDARRKAQDGGIQLIAETIEDTDGSEGSFDVITMLDVLEHLPQPMNALKKLKRLLAPNGIIIISTGNTGALPWWLMRLNYWYYFPEHVSFINRKWCAWASQSLGMKILKLNKFSHFQSAFFMVVRQCLEAIVYFIVHQCDPGSLWYNLLTKIYPFSRASRWMPPKTSAWRDHMLVVFKKVG